MTSISELGAGKVKGAELEVLALKQIISIVEPAIHAHCGHWRSDNPIGRTKSNHGISWVQDR